MRTLFAIAPFVLVGLQDLAAQPGPFLAADLQYAYTVCSDTAFVPLDISIGEVDDLGPMNFGCLASAERNGVWVVFEVASAGRVGFTLSSGQVDADLDFAVWGPFSAWPQQLTTQPVRCSYAASGATTGMNETSVDVNEAASGDGWLAMMNVGEGARYVLYISEFSLVPSEVQLVWQLASGATLQCLPLPSASIGISDTVIEPGGTVDLMTTSTPEVFAYFWELPGSTIATSTERDPTAVQYDLPGCYDVGLTVYNAAGEFTTATTCAITVQVPTTVSERTSRWSVLSSVDGVVVTEDGRSKLSVFDVAGRAMLVREGTGTIYLAAHELPEGLFLLVLEQEELRQAYRLVIR